MKREELENAINNIGDDLIEDAGKIRNKNRGIAKWTKPLAACAALVIVGAGVFAVMKFGTAQKSDNADIEYGNGSAIEVAADKDTNLGAKDEELYVKEQSSATGNAEQYIIGKLIYDDAVYNYVQNENSSVVYQIVFNKTDSTLYRNFLPDGTFSSYFCYLGKILDTKLPDDFDKLFKNPVWYEYGSLDSFKENISNVKRADYKGTDEFFYILTMKNSDLLICCGFNKGTDGEFIRWIQKLEPAQGELKSPSIADYFTCVSKNKDIEISVSDYKKYAVRDAFPEIDVLFKYKGEGEYDLCTYCSLYKQTGDGWEDCSLDCAFTDVLYVLKTGGETMMHYNLSGVKFEDGAVYRLYLGGFGETDTYVEFTYPVGDIITIYDETYTAQSDEDVLSKNICINTETRRFQMTLDPLSSYLPVGYYLVDGNYLTFYTDDGQYSLKFRYNGRSLTYFGEDFQNIKNKDTFELSGCSSAGITGKELFTFSECTSVSFLEPTGEIKIADKEKIDEIIELLTSLTYIKKEINAVYDGGFSLALSTNEGEKHLNVYGYLLCYDGQWYAADKYIGNELHEIKKES